MRDTIIPSGPRPGIQLIPKSISGMLAGIARKALFSRLQRLDKGHLLLNEGGISSVFGEREDHAEIRATLFVHDHRFYTDVVFGGSIGAGEAYMAGVWSTGDLTQLIRIIILNRPLLTGLSML
jgi:cyclopropane-fatty-acyl-phospholipid synthase